MRCITTLADKKDNAVFQSHGYVYDKGGTRLSEQVAQLESAITLRQSPCRGSGRRPAAWVFACPMRVGMTGETGVRRNWGQATRNSS
jgi:hypothetical protein